MDRARIKGVPGPGCTYKKGNHGENCAKKGDYNVARRGCRVGMTVAEEGLFLVRGPGSGN